MLLYIYITKAYMVQELARIKKHHKYLIKICKSFTS